MKTIAYNEIHKTYLALKVNKCTKVTDASLIDKILNDFEIDDAHRTLVKNSIKSYNRAKDRFRIAKREPSEDELSKVMLEIPDGMNVNGESDSEDEEPQVNYHRPLLQVGAKQQYRRTAPIIDFLKDEAKKNKVSVNELIGVVTKQLNYKRDRNSSEIGEKLIQVQGTNDSVGLNNVMPMEKASNIQQNLQLGRTGYQLLKTCLNDNNFEQRVVKLPSWKKLREHQLSIMPPILHDTSIPGVRFDYKAALQMTIKRLLDVHLGQSAPKELTVLIKDGVDGSGSHAIYQQQNNCSTHNIIMYMFCILRITETSTGNVLFQEDLCASPFKMRPLFLILGKECLENLEDVRRSVEERQAMDRFDITLDSGVCHKVTLKAEMSMIDSKMRGLLSGLGGAYCLLCTVDRDTACGRKDVDVESFFNINRNYETTKEDFERLSGGAGEVKKRKNDYEDRKGVTQNPIVQEDLNTVSPLHCLMRSFDFCLNLLYHLRSETFQWTESILQLGRAHQFLTAAKGEVKELVKEKTGIVMDAADPTGMGGNTNKGDVCARLLTDHRQVLVEAVPTRFQDEFNELLCRLWIVVKVYTSKDKVHIKQFKAFSMETYKLILLNFNNEDSKWISISPTVHSLLAHGWELISLNDGKGLGEFTEGGLENNNKFLRFYRRNLARKNSQPANLEDCISRLWLRSDPRIQDAMPKPWCSRCRLSGHHTVSCPQKTDPCIHTSQTLDDFYLSVLLH